VNLINVQFFFQFQCNKFEVIYPDVVYFEFFELFERFECLLVKLVELYVEENHLSVSIDRKTSKVTF